MIADMPFTGIGLNTFPLIQSHFYTGYAIGPEPHAHQLWLQTALDLGIPGLIVFVWLLLSFIYTAVSAYKAPASHDIQVLLVGLAAGVLSYVAAGTLDLSTLGSKPVAALWVMFGLAAAIWSNSRETSSGDSSIWFKSSTQRLLSISLVLAVVLLFLLLPAARARNLALVQAHKTIYQARMVGNVQSVQAARSSRQLTAALDKNAMNSQLLGARGSLYAWLGEEESALLDLEQRVQIDSERPLERYAPFIAWREATMATEKSDPADDLLRVYSQWQHRFPDRADSYILVALTWQVLKNDAAQALRIVEQGVEAGAQPAGLLETYRDLLLQID
jgi:hypothetical protein